jgi:outer membrane receptor protein involved in Fe transport
MTKGSLLASASFALLVAFPAFAQDTTQQTPPGTQSSAEQGAVQPGPAEEGEIIVTATRRAQALSDVPIAVSAVTAEQLQNSGANDIRQLNQLAPSLLVSSATNESSGVARIRGIGTVGENPGLESSVAVFIDGVYRSRTGVGLTELGEVERVEVLRGPQGTLFGRNASAGLLNIVTKKPSFEHEGAAAFTYGNFDYLRAEGSVTGPLTEGLAARLDGVYVKRDGFIRDVVSGRDVNDRDRYLLRGQLLFEPNDDLSVRFIADYSKKNEECCGAVILPEIRNLRRDAAGNVVESPNQLFSILQSLGAQTQLPAKEGKEYVYRTSITPGFDYHQDSSDYGVSAEVNYDLGAANLTSITAYREYKSENGQDADFGALDILRRTDQDRKFETFTQELRLQGELFDGRIDWLVGGYYANETLTVDDDIKYGADFERYANCVLAETFARALNLPALVSVTSAATAGTATTTGCFNPAVAAAVVANPAVPATVSGPVRLLAGLTPGLPLTGFRAVAAALGNPALQLNNTGVADNNFEQKSRNYAFFTHNVFEVIPDRLDLTLGVRYTNERKELDGAFALSNPGTANFCQVIRSSPTLAGLAALPCVINGTAGTGFTSDAAGATKKESEWSGTAVLSFHASEDVLLYGSYSKGYKAGGFNLDTSALDAPNAALAATTPANAPGNGRPEPADLRFDPEKVDAYEIGMKWDGPGIDVNVAAFYQLFKQFQLNTFNGVNFEVTNIESCKDSLNGTDQDASAATGACPAGRTRAGVLAKGVELEVFANPAPDLSTTLGFTLADTEYRKNLVGTNGRPLAPTLFQLPGRQISNAPQYVVTGSMGYTPPVSDTLMGLAYLDFRYQSEVNTGSDLDLEKEQDGFLVVNGRIGLMADDRRWSVELWGQNLFNKRYQQIAADLPLQGGGTYRQVAAGLAPTANPLFLTFPAEPRTYGVTVRTRF